MIVVVRNQHCTAAASELVEDVGCLSVVDVDEVWPGDAGMVVLGVVPALAHAIDASHIASPERKAALYIDVAGAYAQWGKYDQVPEALYTTEHAAPQEARTHRAVAPLVREIVSRGSHGVQSRGREFAQLVGVDL